MDRIHKERMEEALKRQAEELRRQGTLEGALQALLRGHAEGLPVGYSGYPQGRDF